MNDVFMKRLKAANTAGWWTILIAVVLVSIQWLACRQLLEQRPEWVLSLIGSGFTWEKLQDLCLLFIGIFKLVIWVMTLAVIWSTMWYRRMKK